MAAVDLKVFLFSAMGQPDWADEAHDGVLKVSVGGAYFENTRLAKKDHSTSTSARFARSLEAPWWLMAVLAVQKF